MKNRLSLMLLLVTLLSFAQNKFEQGYYIDNSGVKTECLIKNYDWKNNPYDIEVKNSIEDNKITKKNFSEIIEFGINKKVKFIRAAVKIDESSQSYSTLSYEYNPKFTEKTVLLKVLVEGVSNLYYFEDENYDRFFYSIKDKIEQLVYKQYNQKDTGYILTNDSFKQQLFVNFKCNADEKKMLALEYKESDLTDYFITTNNCLTGNTESKIISEKRKFEPNFKVNLLLNNISTDYNIINGNLKGNYKSDKVNSVTFGFEVEVILPYKNKNWSVLFDPSYAQDKKTVKIYKPDFTYPDFILNNDSFTVRLPLGLRRYFKLNKNNNLFTNATFSFNVNNTNIYSYNLNNNTTKELINGTFTSTNFAVGFGYQYKKYTAEFKFLTKTMLNNNAFIGQEYFLNQMSLKLGYKLF